MILKYIKEPNIVCSSYMIGGACLNINTSDLWSL